MNTNYSEVYQRINNPESQCTLFDTSMLILIDIYIEYIYI